MLFSLISVLFCFVYVFICCFCFCSCDVLSFFQVFSSLLLVFGCSVVAQVFVQLRFCILQFVSCFFVVSSVFSIGDGCDSSFHTCFFCFCLYLQFSSAFLLFVFSFFELF